MKTAVMLSKAEYAARYDEHAGSLYRFALCVTGDEKAARSAMTRLFCEGYPQCAQDDFREIMAEKLGRILESYPPAAENYRENMNRIMGERHADLIDRLALFDPTQRVQLLQKVMFG